MSNTSNKGQTLLELVVGLGLLTIVVGALAVTITTSLRNSQFSKNQLQATKYAQEYLEKVRTIKSSDYGVCLKGQESSPCSTWENIWTFNFGTVASGCVRNQTGCTFIIQNGCVVNTGDTKPLCLRYTPSVDTFGEGFSGLIIIEDESSGQKKVTSKTTWNDPSGERSSELITIFSRF